MFKNVIKYFTVFAIIFSMILPNRLVYATTDVDSNNLDGVSKLVKKYVVKSQNKGFYFDIERAKEDGASTDLIEIGRILNNYIDANKEFKSRSLQQGLSISFPVYGNWCGPGYGSGTPVDILDTACMVHDKCYDSKGYFACSCDRELITTIGDNLYRMGTKEKLAAYAIGTYFNLAPCNPFNIISDEVLGELNQNNSCSAPVGDSHIE